MPLDTLPLIRLTTPDDVAAVAVLLADFIGTHWPPADAVERLLALSELDARITALDRPGIHVIWADLAYRPCP